MTTRTNLTTNPVLETELTDMTHALAQAIGPENVAFDTTSRLLYSTDASNYQIIPEGVTFPRNADDVSAIHEIAARYQIPILPRGGGTSLAGQTVGRAVIMDFTRHMRRIRAVNAEEKTVQVEPGLVLGQMNRQLAELGLMFGPDPASADRATLGGCLGNNASGTHSILYRMTADHVRWIDVVLATGEKVRLGTEANGTNTETTTALRNSVRKLLVDYAGPIKMRYPKTWRTVAGYALNRLDPDDIDLAQLIVGSEGTLATIVGAELALVERPKQTALVILHFDDMLASLEATPSILTVNPSAVELLGHTLIQRTRTQPEFARRLHFVEGDPAALLVVEFYGASEQELRAKVEKLRVHLIADGYRGRMIELFSPEHQADVWTVRKAGLGLLASNRSDWKTTAVIEDAAVPVEHLAAYISRIQEVVTDAGAEMTLYAHASAGCLHVRPLLNLKTEDGLRQYRQIGENAVEAVLAFGGTTSGEHGEGLARGEFSERLFGAELVEAFRKVKTTFDPDNLMNPGKVVSAPRMDDSAMLRYGVGYHTPLEIKQTRFDWSTDNGFAGAVEMCNGSGVCRKEGGGVMCPSFMATREEKDSTRGRANMLRLAMSGTLGLEGMTDGRVKGVFDLCLSCKACKAECPSAVDMARLKAEFMAHYQERHGIPLRSRLFANVHRLNRFGSLWPGSSNRLAMLPGLSALGKRFLGIAPERDLPRFAPQRLSRWWASHRPSPEKTGDRQPPILLIDTFTEYYDPHIGQALAYLMDQMGLRLEMQRLPGHACCGRPAVSKGLLDQAQKMQNAMMAGLDELLVARPDARFMMIEPSCASVLRDDAVGLVNAQWRETSQTVAERTITVDEWLDECRVIGLFDKLVWDQNPRTIFYHGHCHQKALWGTIASRRILEAIPQATVQELDAGCCGMAGSFGYEKEHYAVSMAIAGQRLYPVVRENPEAIVAASGTSCRDQIKHIEREACHPVEVVAMACGWTRPG